MKSRHWSSILGLRFGPLLALTLGGAAPLVVFAGSGKLQHAHMVAESELRLILLRYEEALSSGKPEAAAALFHERLSASRVTSAEVIRGTSRTF